MGRQSYQAGTEYQDVTVQVIGFEAEEADAVVVAYAWDVPSSLDRCDPKR